MNLSSQPPPNLDNFDWKFYCNHYADLKIAGINTEKKAIDHYLRCGQKENRIIHPDMIKNDIKHAKTEKVETNVSIEKETPSVKTKNSFFDINKIFFETLLKSLQLQKNIKILDLGCGHGRLAIPLTKIIDNSMNYYGLDANRKNVEWCKTNITNVYPNFNFQQLSLKQDNYEQNKLKVSLPYENETFDFVYTTLLFTHLPPEEVKIYLLEINRVLKKNGKCFLAYFLWNPVIELMYKEGKTDLKTLSNKVDYLSITNILKEEVTAYPEANVINWHELCKLPICEVLYGTWSGNTIDNPYQDIIIAEKCGQ